jgi:hypothetical protein
VSDSHSDDTSPATATAVAEPPKPPATPPGGIATAEGPRPRGRGGMIAVAVVVVLAVVLLGVVVALIVSARGGTKPDAASSSAAFQSAMKKAGVDAQPPAQPVALTSVKTSGSHSFSASFSPEEVAALLNAFPYEYEAAGIRIQLRDTTIAIPQAGLATFTSRIAANGNTYSGTVTLPLSYAGGQISSTGVTDLTVEGITGNAGQKAQVGDALVAYFNAYLAAAPGLTVKSAVITGTGIDVEGTAPDSLTYP